MTGLGLQDPRERNALAQRLLGRETVASALADSIEACAALAPGGWGLTVRSDDNAIRLNAGPIEVFVIREEQVTVFVDGTRIAAPPPGVRLGVVGVYRSVPCSARAEVSLSQLNSAWPLLQDAHIALLKQAVEVRSGYSWKKSHSPAALSFLRERLGRPLPEPDYDSGEVAHEKAIAGWVVKGVCRPRPGRGWMDERAWAEWLVPGFSGHWRTKKTVRGSAQQAPVFFFKGFPKSVLVGEGRLTSGAEKRGDETSIGIETTRVFARPLHQNILRADPLLADASFLKSGPVDTFYPLTSAHVRRIRELAESQAVSNVADAPERKIRWVFFSRFQAEPKGHSPGLVGLRFPCREEAGSGDLAILVEPKIGVAALVEVTGTTNEAVFDWWRWTCLARVVGSPSPPISLDDLRADAILRDWNVAKRSLTAPTSVMPELDQGIASRMAWLLAQRGAALPQGVDGLGVPQIGAVEDDFQPRSEEDARDRINRSIAVRRGRRKFREALLGAYGKRCAITGCDAEDALEAAHIEPYNGDATDHVRNGLLLRADIHTLFDLQLLRIDPDTLLIELAEPLRGTAYEELRGKRLRPPEQVEQHPSIEALRRRAGKERRSVTEKG